MGVCYDGTDADGVDSQTIGFLQGCAEIRLFGELGDVDGAVEICTGVNLVE